MRNIVLIGPPGSGKSAVGRNLSKTLKRHLIDTDIAIEQKTGKKIADIFVLDGEEKFRIIETDVVASSLNQENAIISLGGGAPMSEITQDRIAKSNSFVVFLDVSLATAAPRVGFNRDRPLLLGNPRAQWQELSQVRRPIYEKLASLSIKVDGMSLDEISAQIQASIG